MDYVYAVLVFISVGGYITFIFLDYAVYTEAIGFLAVFTEAMLGVPQFYKNYQNHSTSGMRLVISMEKIDCLYIEKPERQLVLHKLKMYWVFQAVSEHQNHLRDC